MPKTCTHGTRYGYDIAECENETRNTAATYNNSRQQTKLNTQFYETQTTNLNEMSERQNGNTMRKLLNRQMYE